MCLDNRRYTPAAVNQLQTIALVCELRRHTAESRRRMASNSDLARGIDAGLELMLAWLDELAPTPNYIQCDNPPPEAPTLADYTAGMME